MGMVLEVAPAVQCLCVPAALLMVLTAQETLMAVAVVGLWVPQQMAEHCTAAAAAADGAGAGAAVAVGC
jgi:hypothetical protein